MCLVIESHRLLRHDAQICGQLFQCLVRAHELDELAEIYVNRGLDPILARKVAEELTAHDVIRAHARRV